jgi:cystathionine gamma-synthase
MRYKVPMAKDDSALDRELAPATLAIVAGRTAGAPGEPLNVPLIAASNFHQGGELNYLRNEGSPTWQAFEDVLGRLEGGTAVAFSSGMAAVAAVLDTLPVGARVVLPRVCYLAVRQLAATDAPKGRWDAVVCDVLDLGSMREALVGASLLWLETPSNPLIEIADLEKLVGMARQAGARVVVDNTFATPLLQQPLALGADAVVHSVTKWLGGHSDLIMGAVVARDPAFAAQLARKRVLIGAIPGTLEAFLATRGMRTLPLRLRQSQANAQILAERLNAHPKVSVVRYPGLPFDPGHAVARRQMRGFGGVLAFELTGDAAAADRVCAATRVIVNATSLGGVESTMERRARYPDDARFASPSLIRLSIGCEDADDLWADLAQALEHT